MWCLRWKKKIGIKCSSDEYIYRCCGDDTASTWCACECAHWFNEIIRGGVMKTPIYYARCVSKSLNSLFIRWIMRRRAYAFSVRAFSCRFDLGSTTRVPFTFYIQIILITLILVYPICSAFEKLYVNIFCYELSCLPGSPWLAFYIAPVRNHHHCVNIINPDKFAPIMLSAFFSILGTLSRLFFPSCFSRCYCGLHMARGELVWAVWRTHQYSMRCVCVWENFVWWPASFRGHSTHSWNLERILSAFTSINMRR